MSIALRIRSTLPLLSLLVTASTDLWAQTRATEQAQCAGLGPATAYNAFIYGPFTAASSDVEGRIAVAGKLDLNHYSLGDKLSPATAGLSVLVGGDFVFPSGRIYHGHTRVAGSAAGVGAPVRNGLTPEQTLQDQSVLPLDFSSEHRRVLDYSVALNALPANGTYTSQWGGLHLTGHPTSMLQVFRLPGQLVLDAHTFQVSGIPSGATVVFNISGSTAGLTNMSLESLAGLRRKVLFHFPEATRLTLAGISVEGSILAPRADIPQPQGVVKGTVIARSWNGMMQLNHEPFEGCGLPTYPAATCALYPIALPAALLAQATLNQRFDAVVSGAGPGQFGWLTWAGSPSAPTLATSLTAPGDSHTWRHPDQPTDARLDVGDWLQGASGNMNANAVRTAMDALLNRDILVPTWNQVRGQGNNFAYQAAGFVRIQITAYALKGNGSTLSFKFRGLAECSAGNQPPLITSTPVTTALSNTPYTYDVDATDSDAGQILSYALTTRPSGMTINASTGLIAWTPTTAQNGTHPVTVSVSDGAGGSAEQSWTITVSQSNRDPAITSTPVTTALGNTTYTYDVEATDPDAGQTLSFALTVQPSGMTINATTGLITWSPTEAQIGTHPVTVTVGDGAGGSDTQSWTITVSQSNRDPSITSTPVTTALSDAPYTYDVDATDPDAGQTLSYALTTRPSGMTINASTGLIAWTPTTAQIGTHPVTVSVNDGAGGSAEQSWTLTVSQSNRDPAITSTPVTTALSNTPYTYDVDATDPDAGQTLSYALTVRPSGMTINAGTGLIAWTPTEAQIGTHSVTVTVSDGAGGSDTQSWTITVSQSNRDPAITSTPVTTALSNSPYTYDVEATDPDAGQTLSYALTVQPTGMTINASTGLIAWTPTEAQIGTHPVTVAVSDGAGGSDTQSWTITVSQSNRPPQITSTAITQAITDEVYQYDVVATDPDPDQTLEYTLIVQPTGMTIDPATGQIRWSPGVADIGTHPVQVRVSDGAGGQTDQIYSLRVVQANRPPQAMDGAIEVRSGESAAVYLLASDPDGDALTYTVQTPQYGSLSGTAPNLTYTPAAGFTGTDQFTYSASDGTLVSNVATVSITVRAVNQPPTALAARHPLDEDDTLDLLLTGVDPENEPLSFEVLTQPLRGVLTGSGASRRYTPAADFHGTDQFTFRVNDGLLYSEPATVTLDVLPVNDPPRITSAAPATIALDDTLSYALAASDPDGETSFTWRMLESPSTATLDAAGVLRWTATEALQNGAVFEVEVADAAGATDRQRFTVRVSQTTGSSSDLGREFWLGYSDNATRFGNLSDPVDSPNRRLYVVISGPHAASGTVTVPGLAWNQAFTHTPGAATEVVLPPQVMHTGHASIKALGVHISADMPIQVTAHNYNRYSADSFRVLPIQALGTDYTIADRHSYYYSYFAALWTRADIPGQFQIVALEDGTQVQILPRRGGGLGITGTTIDQPYRLTLNRGEAFYLTRPTDLDTLTVIGQPMPSREYTGTRIQASRPVAVSAGNACAYVPANGNACNHLVEQLLPDAHLGVDHYTLSYARRLGGDLYRVVATRDHTLVRIDGVLVGQLAAGEHLERRLSPGVHRIESSLPVSVLHFAYSQTVDNQTIPPIGGFGDPTLALVPSRELWLKQVHFSTPRAYDAASTMGFRSQHASVLVPTAVLASLRLNGQPVTLRDPQTFADLTAGYLDLEPGAHVLEADQAFGLEVYGWDEYDAYAYGGGVGVADAASHSIEVLPPEQHAEVGSRVCVAARARDAAGQLIPFARLHIAVAEEGLRTLEPTFAGSLITDANGRTQYCSVGSALRTERWSFTSGHAAATARVEWRAPTRNHPPVITSTPQLLLNGGNLRDAVVARDPNGDILTYSLVQAPAGMQIDPATGQIQWTPTIPADRKPQRHPVEVRVRDPGGLEDVQHYELEVRFGPYLYVPNTDLLSANPNLGANGVIVEDTTYEWRKALPRGGSYFTLSTFGGDYMNTQVRLVEGPPAMHVWGGDEGYLNIWRLQWNTGSIDHPRFASTELHNRGCRVDNSTLPSLQSGVVWAANQGVDFPVFAPLVDTNGDGQVTAADEDHAIGVTFDNRLHAVSLRDGSTRWLAPEHSASRFIMPAAGDLNGDGVAEIVTAGRIDRRIAAYTAQGQLHWRSSVTVPTYLTAASPVSSAVIADLDNDGDNEVLFGSVVLDHLGQELWRFPDRTPRQDWLIPLVIDMDGDGSQEILFGQEMRNAQGQLLVDFRTALGTTAAQIVATFSAANVDTDPGLELLVVHHEGDARQSKVHLLDHDGRILWGPIALRGMSHAMIEDFDGDGEIEFYLTESRQRISINGEVLTPAPVTSPPNSFDGDIADLDGDGNYEFIGTGFAVVDPIDNRRLQDNISGGLSYLQLGSAHLIDFDHDGVGEVFENDGTLSLRRATLGEWSAPAWNPRHFNDKTRDRQSFGVIVPRADTTSNLADLWLSPPQIDRETPGTIWARVRNRGTAPILQPIQVRFWQGQPD